MNDVTALGGRGYQRFCDNSTKALLIKSVTMGEGLSRIIKNCVTSFIDDPLPYPLRSVSSTRTSLGWTGLGWTRLPHRTGSTCPGSTVSRTRQCTTLPSSSTSRAAGIRRTSRARSLRTSTRTSLRGETPFHVITGEKWLFQMSL